MYYYNGAQTYEQFLEVGQLYQALNLLGLALSSKRACVFGLCGQLYQALNLLGLALSSKRAMPVSSVFVVLCIY